MLLNKVFHSFNGFSILSFVLREWNSNDTFFKYMQFWGLIPSVKKNMYVEESSDCIQLNFGRFFFLTNCKPNSL